MRTIQEKEKTSATGKQALDDTHSCVYNVYKSGSILKGSEDAGLKAHCVVSDAQKADDAVWRNGLLGKMWETGISGKMWRMVKMTERWRNAMIPL